MIGEAAAERLTYSQYVSFAGKPLLVRSNSIVILSHAASFFLPWKTGAMNEPAAAELNLIQRNDGCGRVESSPWFRGRGYFALARFTDGDAVWFNLRTRRVRGFFSDAAIADESRWQKDILPAIVGVLAATMSVTPVHAACLAKNGSGVLLAGRSGVGKSTLAVTMGQLGYGYLCDDWTYLTGSQNGLSAWSLPVPVKLLPEASHYFHELIGYPCARSLNGEIAYEVSPESCFQLSRRNHCPISSVVLLERRHEPGISILPITAAEAITHLSSEIEPLIGPLASAYGEQIASLRSLSNSVCMRASFNASPQDVAIALDQALGKEAPTAARDEEMVTQRNLAQPTDMMHRRTSLNLTAQFEWFEMSVCIDTNSPEILRAVQEAGFRRAHEKTPGIDLHLELVLEEAQARSKDAPPLHVVRDGETTFIEVGKQSWFAFDSEAGNGTGSLAAADRREIAAYFRAVVAVVEPLVRRSMKEAAFS